ncbi:hypothetical protein ANCCAN_13552 [Ancylostoma caninum]|uniref:G-protein coupled receptors family 1 profile domain-containing protein n=1 Tax=Ancylostoma caninum TaxID=29170 RepID=A0A368G7T8_ANCCA|nr:hypothetical protein ANCCAN_13552 [Ancylostoma caninum]
MLCGKAWITDPFFSPAFSNTSCFAGYYQYYCSYVERLAVNLSYIYINSLILLLQVTGVTCNGTIIYMFYRAKHLYKNAALRLLLFVAISDLMHASSTLPYTIYLTTFTITSPIDLDPHYIMFSSTPLPFQLKLKLTLTAAIALQRTLALSLPVLYRKLSSSFYATMSLLIGILLGCVDLFLEFALSPIMRSPNCATMGCFVSDQFLYYWGMSNMVIGLFIIVFTITILFKLRSIQNRSKSLRTRAEIETNRFSQANLTSAGMLLSSLLFITVPSVGVGFFEMIGYSIFRRLGPFYLVGLLCAGTCNGIVYVMLNRDMRGLFKSFFSSASASSTNLFQSSVNK